MMDPISIVAGTVGVSDVCVRLTVFLRDVKKGSRKIDEDLNSLSEDVTAIGRLNDLLRTSFEADWKHPVESSDQDVIRIQALWQATETTLGDCQSTLEKFHALISSLSSGGTLKLPPAFESVRIYLRKLSKEDEFSQLRQKLTVSQDALQMILTAVNVTYARQYQSITRESFTQLSTSVQSLGSDLRSQIALLESKIVSPTDQAFHIALEAAKAAVKLASLNVHFNIPQAVSSIFTGCRNELDDLKRLAFSPPPKDQLCVQKRFVIYGLGGSGKTQFCCKFAQETRQKFWGVFWMDASSSEHAKQSLSRIAAVGKVEPNERAAKSWLASQNKPWLLIIDNADEIHTSIESYFPEGEGGLILVTTRNPSLKVQGTFGPRYYNFNGLGQAESLNLLLIAADEPTPWSLFTEELAADICKALGGLPLALVQAGKTILTRLCTLKNYLFFFERHWNRIRQRRKLNDTSQNSYSANIIHCSFDIICDGLLGKGTQAAQDAIELLNIFSFLHRQHIRMDILLRAVSNPKIEEEEQERRQRIEKNLRQKTTTWSKMIEDLGFQLIGFLVSVGSLPVLPKCLRDVPTLGSFDEFRLREALKELHQMSLILYNQEDDSFSMHPMVHTWVRVRPEMSIGDQAVWCQAASTILSQSILLPPLADTEGDEIFRRDILPHVSHVQKCDAAIQARLSEIQKSRSRPWPVLGPRMDRGKALQLAKFSYIYAQSGLWNEAKGLQLQVADFTSNMLGIEHPVTMDVMLFLSVTYWQLGDGDTASRLQQEVLDACLKFRGDGDLKSLKIMDILGVSRWQQARFNEALKLHERAVTGLEKRQGADHPDTLRAMSNLGRVVGKNFKFTAAVEIQERAVNGLSKEAVLGPYHLDTLIAKDNLAMSLFDRAAHGYGEPGDLDRAHSIESEVLEHRKIKLGKEHPYTLWAACNLARIKALHGDFEEALTMIRGGLLIAERNLGATHIGTLFGKLHLGRVLLLAKRYREAEVILSGVVEAHEGPRTGHPDRLIAIFSLIKCLNMQGREAETSGLREKLLDGTRALFGRDHPWERFLLDPKNLSDVPEEQGNYN